MATPEKARQIMRQALSTIEKANAPEVLRGRYHGASEMAYRLGLIEHTEHDAFCAAISTACTNRREQLLRIQQGAK